MRIVRAGGDSLFGELIKAGDQSRGVKRERHLRPADNVTARAQKSRNPANLHPGVVEEAEIILTFDDNRLASLVFGQFDQNLAHLERRLEREGGGERQPGHRQGLARSSEMSGGCWKGSMSAPARAERFRTGDVDGAIQESTLQGSLFPTAEAPTGA